MEKKIYIEENWGKESIVEMTDTLNISLMEFLELAFNLQLYRKSTPNIRRRWTMEEEGFLNNYAHHLSVREASNLLYRSHYATYQKIRVLGLGEIMINKK
ncbi:hypothetical protein GH839_21550 [Bacillus thuringiensis]|uniref:hypothetical protein n=1 Tax=Bacillus pacificus TaxID=2026187 RepID=UPI00129876D2|nr:hypothetical protein [Bacillus pacificus]MCU5068341.1 hypothetical protein [Bacillus pacificus]MRB23438.1 hypothetical protein [Bacillus thuringiensis]